MCPPSKAKQYAKNINQKQKQAKLSDNFKYKTHELDLLPHVTIGQNIFLGIPNLGNTCYFTVVLHILSVVCVETKCSEELKPIMTCLVALKNKRLTKSLLKTAVDSLNALMPDHKPGAQEDCIELLQKLFESSHDSNFINGTSGDRQDYAQAIKKRNVNFNKIMTYRQIDASCAHQQDIKVEAHPYLSLTVLNTLNVSFYLLPFNNPSKYTHVSLKAPGTFTIRKALKQVLSLCDKNEDNINKWHQNLKRLILIKKNGDVCMMNYEDFCSLIIWSNLSAVETHWFIQASSMTNDEYQNISRNDLFMAIVKLIINDQPHCYYIHVPDFNESSVLSHTNFKISTITDVDYNAQTSTVTCVMEISDKIKVFDSNINLSYAIREDELSYEVEDKLLSSNLKSRLYSSDTKLACKQSKCAQLAPKISYLGSCMMIHFSRLNFQGGNTMIAKTKIVLELEIDGFSLCGIILHSLTNSKYGHYTVVLKYGKSWYNYDDQSVTQIQFSKIPKSHIILAVYNK